MRDEVLAREDLAPTRRLGARRHKEIRLRGCTSPCSSTCCLLILHMKPFYSESHRVQHFMVLQYLIQDTLCLGHDSANTDGPPGFWMLLSLERRRICTGDQEQLSDSLTGHILHFSVTSEFHLLKKYSDPSAVFGIITTARLGTES